MSKMTDVLQYDYVMPDGRSLRVLSPPEPVAPYEGWYVVLGDERIKATDVARYRDGGTTYVRTERGTLHVPFRGKPLWTEKSGTAVVLAPAVQDLEAYECEICKAVPEFEHLSDELTRALMDGHDDEVLEAIGWKHSEGPDTQRVIAGRRVADVCWYCPRHVEECKG
jgi:hypothetical protein